MKKRRFVELDGEEEEKKFAEKEIRKKIKKEKDEDYEIADSDLEILEKDKKDKKTFLKEFNRE